MENSSQDIRLNTSSGQGNESEKTLGVNANTYYQPEPRLGFTPYAELWNGRLAMIGLVLALFFELVSSLF